MEIIMIQKLIELIDEASKIFHSDTDWEVKIAGQVQNSLQFDCRANDV
jgi:hypothetical protein